MREDSRMRQAWLVGLYLTLTFLLALSACVPPAAPATPQATSTPLPATPTPPPATATPAPTATPSATAAPPTASPVATVAGLPAGLTALSEVWADLKGSGQPARVVLAAIGTTPARLDAEALELFVFEEGATAATWRSGTLVGARAEPLRVQDLNRDGRTEVLSVQSMGAAGQTLYVFAWLGDRYGALQPRGGYFDGKPSFGDNGVRVEDADRDGVSEILAYYGPAASQSETYRWDGQAYRAVAAATPTRPAGQGGLALTLGGAAPSYAPGQPVRLTLSARNAGTTPLRLTFPSGQRFDAIALDPAGREVWRWSHGRAFTLALVEIEIAPGQSQTHEIVWEQKDNEGRQLPAGKYTVRAWLTAQGAEQRVQVEVTLAGG
ncbi:MAG: BsuPI-related putative proteinase inhibitor [Chloroflexota bacterium]